ncbi:hypothetical protein [Streptomyces chumphonensis]|uniref:hypothetical protein n=1 Tax=Streptomyces chumphonensis TaxID=1214925 RepID=UPI003D716F56
MVDAQVSGIRALIDENAGGNTDAATVTPAASPWDEGGKSDLNSDTRLWNAASSGVDSLRDTLKPAAMKLDDGRRGLGPGDTAVTGLLTGAAQTDVHDTWARYLDLLARESAELSDKLTKAGSDHYANEEAVAAAFRQQLTKPEDPTSVLGLPPFGVHAFPSW